MKKITAFLLTAILTISGVLAQPQVLEYNFNDGDKTGIAFYDVDQLTPSSFMQSIGFAVDNPWILIMDSATSKDMFIGSTSQYTPAGQANDWMVLPAVEVLNENMMLEWKSQAFMANKRDGLKIFISTEGNQPSDFPADPVWEIEQEEIGATEDYFEGEFISHELSLAQYVGKTIYIAFVNQSYDKSIIAIDDIKVYSNDKFALNLNLGNVVNEVDEVVFEGEIINYQYDKLDEVAVTLEYDGVSVSETFSNLNIARGESAPFKLNHKMPIELNQTIRYEIHAVVGSDKFDYASSVTNTFRRRVVIEEHTGVRCGYCPLGTWAIDSIKEIAPDKVAPIAVQCAQLGSVNLLVEDYTGGLFSNGLTAYPIGWIDRTYAATPNGNANGYHFDDEASWISLFNKQLNEVPEAGVSVTAVLSDDKTSIIAETKVRTAVDKNNLDWRVVYVLTEDSVTGYFQSNNYSGHNGYVGGWEKKPKSVEVELHDLARGIYPNFYGLEGSMPSTMSAGVEERYSYTFDIPYTKVLGESTIDFVQDIKNLNVVAMVVDGKTKRVINADMARVKDLTAIKGVTNNAFDVTCVSMNGAVRVIADQNVAMTVSLIALDGRVLATTEARGTATLDVAGYQGIALVQVVANGAVEVTKVVVR